MKRAAAQFEPMGLDTQEAGRRIGVGVSSVYQLRRDDPTFPKPREVLPGVFRFVRDELDAWLLNRPTAKPQAEPSQLRSRKYRDGKPVEGRSKRQAEAAE